MQEEKTEDPQKTCGSKYGLETKCIYITVPGLWIEPSAGEEPLRYRIDFRWTNIVISLSIQKISPTPSWSEWISNGVTKLY